MYQKRTIILSTLLALSLTACGSAGQTGSAAQSSPAIENDRSVESVESAETSGVGGVFERDRAAYAEVLAQHPDGWFAFADLAEDYDVLLLTDSAFDNLDGTYATVSATVYTLDANGASVELGTLEAGGSATPLAAQKGYLYCGGNKVMCRYRLDEAAGKLVCESGVRVAYDTEENPSYFTGTDPEHLETPADEAAFDQLFDEYFAAPVLSFQRVTEREEAPDARFYSVATDLDKEHVEATAAQVRELILKEDWKGLSKLLDYPFTMTDDTELEDADAFVAYMKDRELSEAFRQAVEAEDCVDLFANYQGVCMGDGEVWLGQRGDEPELKVIALNGIVG